MYTVLSTLLRVILPLSIPVVSGVLLVRFKKLDTKPLLTMVMYYLMPCMVFNTLSTAQISMEDIYSTIIFTLCNLAFLWALANILGKVLSLPSPEAAGLTLVSTLTNAVNYGLPLVSLAFGQAGVDKASAYIIIQIILVNTVGVFFAARSNFSIKDSVRSIFSLPSIYAAILAFLFRVLPVSVPSDIATGLDMIAKAYSPVVLAILGAQMAGVENSKLEKTSRATFWIGIAIRMLLSPFVAWLALFIMGTSGVLFSVLFILASTPVAVNAVILAEKFDASPKIVSKCILWTTLGSFVILPVLIELVK